ncbi:MAG: RNA polymerase sigma factor [Bacteroidota bacterium]
MKNLPQNLSEQEIVTLLRQRDLRGISALYDQYGNFIFGLIYEVVNLEDLAEIVLQDTFLKVWNKIDSFSFEKGRFLTWLMNVARNTAIDMMRSKNYKQTMRLISLDSVPNDLEKTVLDIRMENIDLRDIVARLDKKYEEVIALVYFKGYTHVEVSDELGLPLGTVKSRIRKAFKDLRGILEE